MSYNKRQEANRKIIQMLSIYVEQHPDIRFHQMLYNVDATKMKPVEKDGEFTGLYEPIDLHGEESEETLKRIKESNGWE